MRLNVFMRPSACGSNGCQNKRGWLSSCLCSPFPPASALMMHVFARRDDSQATSYLQLTCVILFFFFSCFVLFCYRLCWRRCCSFSYLKMKLSSLNKKKTLSTFQAVSLKTVFFLLFFRFSHLRLTAVTVHSFVLLLHFFTRKIH